MANKYALIDMSVLIYQVYFRNYKWYNQERHTEKTLINFLFNKLNELIAPAIAPGFTPIYIFDKKKDGVYWRQRFIDDNAEFYTALWSDPKNGRGMNTGTGPNDEKYKGGRLKAKDYNAVLGFTRTASELFKTEPYIWFEEPGLEADDLFALFVKYVPSNVHLDLVTVDRDISGLLKLDNPHIRFIDLYPKRRYEVNYAEDIVKYFKNKLHPSIETPEEAYYWKQQLSEVGDNLLAGCHIELIDLVNHCAPISYGFASTHEAVINFYATGNSVPCPV